MKLAVLGTDDDVTALVTAALRLGHEVAWLADLRPQDACLLGEIAPHLTSAAQWEGVLDHALADAVIVGRGTISEDERLERLRRLAADAIPTLCTFPTSTLVLPYYELDMIGQETGVLLRSFLPLANAEATEQLARWVAEGHEVLGTVRQIAWTRQLHAADRVSVIEALARDATAVVTLCGSISKVSAFGPSISDADFGSLNVQLVGPAQMPVHWTVAKTDGAADAQVSLVGDRGRLDVSVPDDLTVCDPWIVGALRDDDKAEWELSAGDPFTREIERLAEAVGHDHAAQRSFSNWDQATRVMEVVDAVQLSLQRGRTIEVVPQQLTEQLAFKGVMSALGCGLLLLGMLVLLLAGIVGDTVVPGLMRWWPLALVALLLFFLLLQLVPAAAGKHRPASQDAEADQTTYDQSAVTQSEPGAEDQVNFSD